MADTLKTDVKQVQMLRKDVKQLTDAIATVTVQPQGDPSTNEITYEVEQGNSGFKGGNTRFKITVPAGSRLTYGPISPAHGGSHYLRFYKGQSQFAVFDNVVSFHDVSLKIVHEEISERAETVATTSKGKKSSRATQQQTRRWVDDDDEDDDEDAY